MSDPFDQWEHWTIRVGIFTVFVATFIDYVFHKIWPIIGPLFRRLRPHEPDDMTRMNQ